MPLAECELKLNMAWLGTAWLCAGPAKIWVIGVDPSIQMLMSLQMPGGSG